MDNSVQEAIRSHHEELDGSGYPKGIDRKRIFLIMRIISTVDDFCAMTELRGYNVLLDTGAAISELEKDIGNRYDAKVIRALRNAVGYDI